MLMNTLRISLFIRFVFFFNFLLKFNFCIFSVLVLTENQMTRSQTVHPTSATCNTDAKNHCDRDNFVWWIIASATYCREDKRSLYIWPCFILTLIFFSTRLKLISLWLPFLICSQDFSLWLTEKQNLIVKEILWVLNLFNLFVKSQLSFVHKSTKIQVHV